MTRPTPPHARVITRVEPDEREAQRRPLDRRLMLRLFDLTRPYARKRNTLIVMVLIRAVQLPMLGWALAAVINGPIFEGIQSGELDTPRLALWTAGFLLLAALTAVVFHFRMRLALELGEQVVRDLRQMIFEHLQRMSMRFYNRTKLGRIISRMTSDAESVRMGVQDVLFVSLVQGGQMVVAAGVMLWYDPPLFGVVLAIAPVLYGITHFFRSRLFVAWQQVQESFSRVTATLAESVNGIRVTQGFVRQEVNASLFRDLVADHSSYNLRAARLGAVFLPLLELNSQFFISVLLVLGGHQVVHGGFGAGGDPAEQFKAIVTFFIMVPLFFGPVSVIGRMYNISLTAMAGAERVFRLLDEEPERIDEPDAVELPPIDGRVEFRDVTFGYDPGKPVLHGLNFTAEPGKTIALVGHTGSGKSSIINLIAKFYVPDAGQILIDGYDVKRVSSDSLARQLGIVLQQNFLFTGTVIDNIRVGRPDADDAQVVEAARSLDCLDLFEAMPDGFYTDVGEKGSSLSLGQRQLVCFTRALLADPRILILDEATSSVDTMTEARIQRALSLLLAHRTSFVVAHRLSTIRHADEVLVLDQGRIVERGTHNELLAHAGVYANLYRQFIRASEA